jgi:hypothetical protein
MNMELNRMKMKSLIYRTDPNQLIWVIQGDEPAIDAFLKQFEADLKANAAPTEELTDR